MPSQFDALADDESDESDNAAEDEHNVNTKANEGMSNIPVPAYEDLSMTRLDEETVLDAVYGNDFHKKDGPWGSRVFCVNVRPPDIHSNKIGSQVTLSIQLGKKYPYLPPKVVLSNVKGLSGTEQTDLLKQLNDRCHELSRIGSVMVCELVQLTEDFLYSHNIDPTMSAYDAMKAREEKERNIQVEKEKKLHSFMDITDEDLSQRRRSDISRSERSGNTDNAFDSAANDRIQKELDRRDAAFNDSRREAELDDLSFTQGLKASFEVEAEEDDDDDDDDDDFQFDEPTDSRGSNSRYTSDFIELGMIGRGGGGTVFKVRNRLDRRIYAVKKVILQSEQGKMQQIDKLENSKLRREVTTISRMTHRHIVRYYQAWVEGGDKDEGLVEGDDESEDELEEECISVLIDDHEAETSDEDESKKGFWGKRPSSSPELGNFVGESDWSNDSDTSSDNDEESTLNPQSKSDEDDLFPDTPLMKGLGFENQSYSDLFKRGRKESIASSDDLGFHSSMMDQLSSQNTSVNKSSNSIMYIQMEYCPRQLMTLLGKSETNDGWKMIRQILEALVYIHKRKIIHRDLKPGNIFLDAENNVRLGDFGLATTRNKKTDILPPQKLGSNGALTEIDDSSEQLDRSKMSESVDISGINDDITGGVGTTFYIAPEQAGRQNTGKGQNDYDMKADIFSLGVVVFEMFFHFSTRMERATTLQTLRGDNIGGSSSYCHLDKELSSSSIANPKEVKYIIDSDGWKEQALQRFPKSFREEVAPEIQKLILWCLERSPEKRPTAEQLLKSPLIPRQMELDHRYLKDALQTIANPESESHEHIIKALFDRHAMQHVEMTYDTDDVAKIQKQFRISSIKHGRERPVHPIELLGKSLKQIGGFTSGDVQGIRSSAMSLLSMSAATSTLRRAKGAGKIAKGEVLRNATQHAATVLAMNSATAAAARGHTVGVNGADPRVVKSICDQLICIFESHGAIPLKPPMLRPKGQHDISIKHIPKLKSQTDGSSIEPAEVINELGNNLLLPEDLQVNFARTIGRGGGALSNVKRYEIGTSFLKSISGGHPRESLEASFDIVLEDQESKNEIFVAETIMVICQAFSILSPHSASNIDISMNIRIARPIWILRLTHTRLADAILDICGVPVKDTLRKACYHILTCCIAPPPSLLWTTNSEGKKIRGKKRKINPKKICGGLIDLAIREHGLPKGAAARLRAFLNSGCLPLPVDISAAVNALEDGTKKLRSMDDQRHHIPRRQKRYEDVARGLRSIRNCINALTIMGIKFHNESAEDQSHHFPAYISLDLGLRQPAQHYHGQIYFQAIMLTEGPESIVSNDTLLSGDSKGIKFAEGGRYDDLVRRFRPPGNFAASQVNQYTSAPIPVCTGVRFMVGAFVERVYVEAALKSRIESEKTTSLTADSDILRRVLAVPYISQKGSVQCVVVGTNGFDSASLPERAMVASHLWMKGISAEFIPHSGVILSLLKHSEADTSTVISDTNEWTLDQICDLCCLLHIPFVVVVQQHLLRERKSVRLRHTIHPSSAQNGLHESFVTLTNLASEIKDIISTNCLRSNTRTKDSAEYDGSIAISSFDRQPHPSPSLTSRIRSASTSISGFEYIYVDTDQFYLNPDKSSGGKDPKLKAVMKVMKKAQLKADKYIENELDNILVVDLPFRITRGFNSDVMFNDGASIVSATSDFLTKHPKHRKTLKTFAMCLDFMLRRYHDADDKSTANQAMLSILVYAQPDDRFDLLTLETSRDSKSGQQNDTSGSRKKDKSGRR